MKQVEQLIKYYKDKGLTIIGLNDSQGVNTTTLFYKKGLLEYLASSLSSDNLKPEVINAFSLMINKTEHIDYILRNNLSLEEIKLSQIYSVVSAFEKVMIDLKLPKFIGQVGNVYKLIYNPNYGDENIRITTVLQESVEPTLIYSSGVNNLMREIGSNPFTIKNDYKLRNKKPNYNYALEKASNPYTLKKVLNGIEVNFDNILSINDKTDIYTLGAYVPKSLEIKDLEIFRDLVLIYNEELERLCKLYSITFIDTQEVGKKYNGSTNNFHISTKGHNALADTILGAMYQNKILSNQETSRVVQKQFEITNLGSEGMISNILKDYREICEKKEKLSVYGLEREIAKAEEKIREMEVFENVLTKRR